MRAILLQINRLLHAPTLIGQLLRFGIAGGISTLVYTAVYLPLAYWVLSRAWVALAVPPAFLIAAAVGFPLHSLWSFRGHGTRDNSGRQHFKFLFVQAFGLTLNLGFTWLLATKLHFPPWVPLLPVIFVTPFVTFGINRIWVFG